MHLIDYPLERSKGENECENRLLTDFSMSFSPQRINASTAKTYWKIFPTKKINLLILYNSAQYVIAFACIIFVFDLLLLTSKIQLFLKYLFTVLD